MPRNLDTTLAAHLGDPVIRPAVFAEIRFRSGIERVWSGVGDFVGPNGHTFSGLGEFASVSPIGEGTDVKAEGTSVTLSGIGLSLIDIPGLEPPPPDPPFPPAPGESVAFSFGSGTGYGYSINQDVQVTGPIFSYPPSILNANLGFSGTATGHGRTGAIALTNGQSPAFGAADGAVFDFVGFSLPPEIPPGAVITHVYPMTVSVTNGGGLQEISCLPAPPGSAFGPGTGGLNVGPDVHTVGGKTIRLRVESSTPGAASLFLGVSFAVMAIYYIGTPRTKMSLLQEALGDVWVGAPAKIWFGLMNVGAATLLGVPYLVFSGVVDKPSVHIGTDTLSITLALENRLVNLQRANQRRYTAADQKIYFPTDMAFNWVESLNDIALRWGS